VKMILTRYCCAATCGEAGAEGRKSEACVLKWCSPATLLGHACMCPCPPAKASPLHLWRSGLGCTLKLLNLTTDCVGEQLATAIGHHVQPAALTLHVDSPIAGVWLPQLRECIVSVHSSAQIDQLNSRLKAASLAQLSSLVLQDMRPAAERLAAAPALPALPRLPALRELVSVGETYLAGA